MTRPQVLCYWPDEDCVCPGGDHVHHTLADYERLERIWDIRPFNFGKYQIRKDRNGGWYVWVPLTDPDNDYDEAGFIVAPAGESWWKTREGACAFVCAVDAIKRAIGTVHYPEDYS